MALFTNNKNSAYAVPNDLKAAYREATPDTAAHLNVAADQIAEEIHARRAPRSAMLPARAADDVRAERMPEVLRRAEHLSRLKIADEAVNGPARAAEIRRTSEEARTCPICQSVAAGSLSVRRAAPGMPDLKMCDLCRSVAAQQWAQANATPERVRAVSVALRPYMS